METLLADNHYKDIIISSSLLAREQRVKLNAFAIMDTHIHLIWQCLQNFTPSQNQSSFMKYTSQQILQSLSKDNESIHASLRVSKYDRNYGQDRLKYRKIIIIHQQDSIMMAQTILEY